MICPKENESSTFAIVQLSCMEDMIQTLQATMELKKSHPEVLLLLICREVFSRPLEFKLKEAFDHIIYLNSDELFNSKDALNISDVKKNLKHLINNINTFSINVVINLSCSIISGHLTALIQSEHKLGFVSDQLGNLTVQDHWSQYLYSNTLNGPHGSFSLVDAFKGMLGTHYNSYTKNHRKLKKKKIVIHPFSNHRKKKWSLGKWSEVIYQTLKNYPDVSILLVGSAEDKKETRQLLENPILKKFQDRLIDIAGVRTIEETYHEFRDASLFVGHDSIWGHLASLFNVQTLTISLGTTRPNEKTPYGTCNYNISPRISCFPCFPEDQCELLPCHKDISHNVLSAVVDTLMKDQDVCFKVLQDKIPPLFLDKVDIYQTHVDKEFGMFLVNCLHEEETIIDIFRNFYRVLWSFILADQELNLPFPGISLDNFYVLENYCTALNHLAELNKFGRTYSRYIIEEIESQTSNITDIKKYSNKLLEVDQLLIQLKDVYPHLSPVIGYYQISKANIPGTTVKEIAEFSLITYHEALGATEILLEFITTTLKSSKHHTATPSPQILNDKSIEN